MHGPSILQWNTQAHPCSSMLPVYRKSVRQIRTDQNFGQRLPTRGPIWIVDGHHFWRSSLLKFWLTCVKDEHLVIRSTDNIQVYPGYMWLQKKHSNSLAHVWCLTIWLFGLKLQQSGTFRIRTYGDNSFLEGIDIHNPIATSKNSMQSCISAQFLVYSLVMSSRPNDKQSGRRICCWLASNSKRVWTSHVQFRIINIKTPRLNWHEKPNV